MNKFLVITCDMDGVPDLVHPSELFGKDKQDILNILLQNTPKEYIHGIYTVEEFLSFIQSNKFKQLCVSYKLATPATVDSISNQLFEQFNQIQIKKQLPLPTPISSEVVVNQPVTVTTDIKADFVQKEQKKEVKQVKYFKDNDSQFKIQNGELYKKVWEDMPEDQNEIRLVYKETGKLYHNSKISIQQLVWKKLNV